MAQLFIHFPFIGFSCGQQQGVRCGRCKVAASLPLLSRHTYLAVLLIVVHCIVPIINLIQFSLLLCGMGGLVMSLGRCQLM